MAETENTERYQVLARKYRPETFSDLVGQEAMVRTLKNAFEADRIAQAFIMTGIRGTGKTTTARIISKGINCIGPDGTGKPTTEPCGQCEHCVAIMEGRHVDVLEMDAASRTGVGDIREIIDSIQYATASARYKIYIIDEVHMLSTAAFNALLKTLEEPPAHVKFIFATTEIRKVPVTVLSRCQRYDLRRIEPEAMIELLRKIADKEGCMFSDDALALITRAAEGSARDATSLLDQAIAHGGGETTAEQVRTMLGLADRGRVLDLFEHIMAGRAADALQELSAQYADGADPLTVLRDLSEITHWLSVSKITPDAANDPAISPDERKRGLDMASRLPMRVLSRAWQILLKVLEESATSPNSMMSAEMAVIRLTHVADLPSPGDLARDLSTHQAPPPLPASDKTSTQSPAPPPSHRQEAAPRSLGNSSGGGSSPQATALALDIPQGALAHYASFADVLALIGRHDMKFLIGVEAHVQLISYAPGRIEFSPTEDAPPALAQELDRKLHDWTGHRWMISVRADGGEATIQTLREEEQKKLQEEVQNHPTVQAVFAHFPKAKITKIHKKSDLTAEEEAQASALPEAEENWDPFEND